MQVRGVRAPGVESNRDQLRFHIRLHVLNTLNLHQRVAKLAHAFVALVSRRRDLDAFEDFVVGGVVKVVRIGWVHRN